mmetsp:Transcript_44329/g.96513  ORF Transcript_44329/g.96513 Transcript_44329/m.96513 type:complete len:205 (+) Transcript_44329:1200-1814(+)
MPWNQLRRQWRPSDGRCGQWRRRPHRSTTSAKERLICGALPTPTRPTRPKVAASIDRYGFEGDRGQRLLHEGAKVRHLAFASCSGIVKGAIGVAAAVRRQQPHVVCTVQRTAKRNGFLGQYRTLCTAPPLRPRGVVAPIVLGMGELWAFLHHGACSWLVNVQWISHWNSVSLVALGLFMPASIEATNASDTSCLHAAIGVQLCF